MRLIKFKKIISIVLLCTLVFNIKLINNNDKKVKAVTISEEVEWNLKTINAENSYRESEKYRKVKVALLDSGLDFDTDIPFVEREDFVNDGNESYLFQDSTGHGTSVAGIICAKKSEDRPSGIAANVELYVARILDENNQSPVNRVIKAVNWAIDKKVDIIHMSFGTKEYSEELEDVINKAYKKGILIVASAGNNGRTYGERSSIEYPGVFDNVITVGATNKMNGIPEYSSTGKELDVVAPGDQVLTAGAFEGVSVSNGTTISAAHVTGLAAVLWGRYPNKSNEFIKGLLVGSANAETVKDEDCGNGLVDLKAAEKNYEEMNKEYESNKKEGLSEKRAVDKAAESLEENTNKVETHPEVNYVNGSWGKDVHESFITGKTDIDMIKNATTKSDSIAKMKGLSAHPYYHGGENYFIYTDYLLKYAIKMKNAKSKVKGKAAKEIKVPNNKKCKKLVSSIKKAKKKLFKDCKANTNKEKAEVLLGVAIHNMTDAYTHNIEKKYKVGKKSYYIKIIHDKDHSKYASNWLKNSKDEHTPNVVKNYKKIYSEYAIADDKDKLNKARKTALKVSKRLLAAYKEKKNSNEWYKKNKCKLKGKCRLRDYDSCYDEFENNDNGEHKFEKEKVSITLPHLEYVMKGTKLQVKVSDTKKNLFYDIFYGKKKKGDLIKNKDRIQYKKNSKKLLKTVKLGKNDVTGIDITKDNTSNFTCFFMYGKKHKVVHSNIQLVVQYSYKDKDRKKVVKEENVKREKDKTSFTPIKVKDEECEKPIKEWITKDDNGKKVTYKINNKYTYYLSKKTKSYHLSKDNKMKIALRLEAK